MKKIDLTKLNKYIEENPTSGKPLTRKPRKKRNILSDKLIKKMKKADKIIKEFEKENDML